MSDKDYVLAIHSPYNIDELLGTLGSDTPFMAISAGDLIDPAGYALDINDGEQKQFLRIERLKHSIELSPDLNRARHRIDVYTVFEIDPPITNEIRRRLLAENAGIPLDELLKGEESVEADE